MLMTREVPARQKSIVFIGFMGVGKTTIGELVAKKLYRSFIDIDQEIENEFGMPASEIFEKHGEASFRESERNLIKSICSQKLKIVSVGGGAFMQQEVRDVCLANCIVIHLQLSWDEWKDRLNSLMDNRPNLQSRNVEEIEKLYYERQETYSLNNSELSVDDRTPEEIADSIVDSIKLGWELYDPN